MFHMFMYFPCQGAATSKITTPRRSRMMESDGHDLQTTMFIFLELQPIT